MSGATTKAVGPQGRTFVFQWCPECGVLNLAPIAPWHAMDCSEPDLEEWIAQIVGRKDLSATGGAEAS